MNETHVETIQRFPLFQGYTAHGIRHLLDAGEVKALSPGDMVCREGDPPTFVLLLLTGELEVFVERGGSELVLASTLPGTILGELAVYCDINRSASVRAVEQSEVLRWGAETFHRLLLGDFSLTRRVLGRSLRTLIEKEQSLIQALVEGRSADA